MTTIYGISNCDTVKKARKWLEQEGVEHQFHDFRKDGINADQVSQWLTTLGWEALINKRSTTWKQLDEASRQQLNDQTAVALILANPTLIKRPLLAHNDNLELGFKAEQYQTIFA